MALLLQDATTLTLRNTLIQATFDLTNPSISSLGCWDAADGLSETLSRAVALEVEDPDGNVHSSTDGAPAGGVRVIVHANTSTLINVSVAGIVDHAASPLVSETWTLALAASSRRLSWNVTGSAVATRKVRAVRRSIYLRATSVTGLFERGVVQMRGAGGGKDFFGATDPARRVYALGGGTTLDVGFPLASERANLTTVLLSSASGDPYWSGA